MRNRILGVTATVAVIVGLGSASAQADTIRVQSTTDTVDAGFVFGMPPQTDVAGILEPMYKQAHPEDTLNYTGVGTGLALDNARAGLADVVITHAPSLARPRRPEHGRPRRRIHPRRTGIGCVETAEHAAVAGLAPQRLRGSAFGMLATVQSLGNLAASSIAGLLWTLVSPAAAFTYAAALMVLALIAFTATGALRAD